MRANSRSTNYAFFSRIIRKMHHTVHFLYNAAQKWTLIFSFLFVFVISILIFAVLTVFLPAAFSVTPRDY